MAGTCTAPIQQDLVEVDIHKNACHMNLENGYLAAIGIQMARRGKRTRTAKSYGKLKP